MATTTTPSTELLDLLCKRVELLRLLDDGVTDKRELEECVGCSRSTLNRALRELETRGLVVSSPGTIDVTAAGDVAASVFSDVWQPVADAVPLIKHLDESAPFDPTVLDGARILEASVPDPDEPLDALFSGLERADRVEATVPTSSSHFARLFADRIGSLDEAEFVIAEQCLETLRSKRGRPLDPLLNSDVCTVSTTPERPPYALVVLDDRELWLGINDDRGRLSGAIINDGGEPVDWARDVVASFRTECD